MKLLRQAKGNTSLFAFAGYLDLEQRLRLFEAGVDDYVCEPFFALEIAVRLGLSIRLRQAASATGWMSFALAIWNWIWCDEQRRDRGRRSTCAQENFCCSNT